jgi:hypothetical protein
MFYRLHFDGVSQKGVMFYMIGALLQFGKIGIVCLGDLPEEAYIFYSKTVAVFDAETVV